MIHSIHIYIDYVFRGEHGVVSAVMMPQSSIQHLNPIEPTETAVTVKQAHMHERIHVSLVTSLPGSLLASVAAAAVPVVSFPLAGAELKSLVFAEAVNA